MSSPRPSPPATCPVCGADLPPNARACPECGADERAGWDEEASHLDGVDLPGEGPSYGEILENEGLRPRAAPVGRSILRWVAVGLAILAIASLLMMWRR